MKALIFHKMDTEEISDRYVVPCFVSGLEVYDSEINLGTKENMISNEFARRRKISVIGSLVNDLDFGDIPTIEGIEVHIVCKMGKNRNGYPRKGQNSKPKRQNRARERKERKEKSKSKPSQKVNKVKSKSTPG
ncbi:hypothetical protein Tco_0155604 [Tanacetum coccineum]